MRKLSELGFVGFLGLMGNCLNRDLMGFHGLMGLRKDQFLRYISVILRITQEKS